MSAVPGVRGHDNYVTSAAFSPGGQRVVSASLDKTVRVWDDRGYNGRGVSTDIIESSIKAYLEIKVRGS